MTTSTMSPVNACSETASAPLTSSPVAHLASRLAWLANVVASMTIGGCGVNTSEWSQRYDHAGWLRRIRQASLRWTLDGRSETSLQPWTRWGMWAGGVFGELATLERPTDESASSSWPTHRTAAKRTSRASLTRDGHWSAPALEQMIELAEGTIPHEYGDISALTPQARQVYASAMWPTPAAMHPNDSEGLESWRERKARNQAKWHNNGMETPLGVAVRLWPTPTKEDSHSFSAGAREWSRRWAAGETIPTTMQRLRTMAAWPTPTARDGDQRGTQSGRERAAQGHTVNLPEMVRDYSMPDRRDVVGRLNPDWVETLMGFPIGWTDFGPPVPVKRNQNGSRPGARLGGFPHDPTD